MERQRVLACYREGVDAVVACGASFDAADWLAPTPCSDWVASELAAHLRTTAQRYHRLLDAAIAGAPETIVTGPDLARCNARMLDDMAEARGDEHVEAFDELARDYLERLPEHWDVAPYWRGWQHSAGEHAGVAANEWHIHAWDLAQAVGIQHRPSDPELIVTVWCAVLPWLADDLDSDEEDPWLRVLRASGREPTGHGSTPGGRDES